MGATSGDNRDKTGTVKVLFVVISSYLQLSKIIITA
jgi:hypothetical protein